MPEETETTVENAPPEDYAAYEAWAAEQGMQPGNVQRAEDDVEDDETASEATEETPAAETAEESETSETTEQEEEDEDDEEEPEDKPKGKGVQKRISKLTQKIRDLEQRLAAGEKKEPEVAEPEAVEKPKPDDGKPVAPKLADFESYELYEDAHAEFVEKLTDWKAAQKDAERQKEQQKQELERAQAEHQGKWAEAASRFDDFNEVVGSEDVKISPAMENVLKMMEPEAGTALSYYLGKHPEESLRIANATLAENEQQWRAALAKAGRELGKLEDKLEAPKPKGKPSAPAPKKETPKVTAAPKPPAKVAGTRAAGTFDVQDESSAEDYESWVRARNKQLKNR